MANNIKMDLEKLQGSYETVSSLESCVSTHNFHNYFYEMERYIDSVNRKHNNCISGHRGKITEIVESVDKIKNKLNLLSDSLRKTITFNSNGLESNDNVQYKNVMEPSNNNDSSQIIVPLPTPEIEENKPLFPEGYDTTPIGLGIAAAGVTASIGAAVVDSMIPKSYKRNKDKPTYEIDDNDETDYRDYKIAAEAEEKPIVSLKIDPSMTSYQATRNKEEMKKFYDDIDRQ